MERQEREREAEKDEGKQRDRRQVHKLSGDEKTTEEQLNNATSPHSSIPYRPLALPGVFIALSQLARECNSRMRAADYTVSSMSYNFV